MMMKQVAALISRIRSEDYRNVGVFHSGHGGLVLNKLFSREKSHFWTLRLWQFLGTLPSQVSLSKTLRIEGVADCGTVHTEAGVA